MSFTITVSDRAVIDALNRLVGAVENPKPYLQSIGEDIVTRIKERFSSASGPDGQPWAANSPVTLARYIESHGGKNFRKDGRINKTGANRIANKKPLQGHHGDLKREFHVDADKHSVTIGNTMKYAAMQQFGGTKAQFPNLWGDIPARPFMPITATGELYPQDRDLILEGLTRYIQDATQE